MKITPIFNMKGGVAKTTSAVMLAEALAQYCSFKVLIADADPQLNATRMLLTTTAIESTISGPQNHAKTIARYLLKSVNEATIPNPAAFVTARVGTIHGKGQVDLLAGTPRTGEVADTMLLASANPGRSLKNILEKAALALKKLNEAGPYDVLIIDCPPGLTMPVRAALAGADLLIVPTTADDTAHAGIGNLVWNLRQCPEVRPAVVEQRRVLVTRYESAHEANLSALNSEATFKSYVSERPQIWDARLFSPQADPTFKGKYGAAAEREFKKIMAELTVLLGLSRPEPPSTRPLPKEELNVKGDQNSRELPQRASAHRTGKSSSGKKTGLSDLFSFSRRDP